MIIIISTLAAAAALLIWKARSAARLLFAIAAAREAFTAAYYERPPAAHPNVRPIDQPAAPPAVITDTVSALVNVGMRRGDAKRFAADLYLPGMAFRDLFEKCVRGTRHAG